MEPQLRALLVELETWGQDNDQRQQERSKKMLNLARESAQFLSMLVRSSRRTRLLEVGTSNGYSTIWLAWAAHATGGHVTSVERNADKIPLAEANLRRAGLLDCVTLIQGDATEVVARLPGPFDFVLFDADRLSAPAQFQIVLPKLTAGALVLSDNALSHPEEISGYLAVVQARQEFDHLVVPIGKGLSLAYKREERG
jgi:predicted O-methyltransferase YrrM